MGVRSTGSQHPTTTQADGHLLEYFRQNFSAGGGGTNYVAPPPAPKFCLKYSKRCPSAFVVFG